MVAFSVHKFQNEQTGSLCRHFFCMNKFRHRYRRFSVAVQIPVCFHFLNIRLLTVRTSHTEVSQHF